MDFANVNRKFLCAAVNLQVTNLYKNTNLCLFGGFVKC